MARSKSANAKPTKTRSPRKPAAKAGRQVGKAAAKATTGAKSGRGAKAKQPARGAGRQAPHRLDTIGLAHVFATTPDTLYRVFTDSRLHTEVTGARATGGDEVGQPFTAWDGYASGVVLALEPGRRIVQAWRTTEFSARDDDSMLVLEIEPHERGAVLAILHSQLPPGSGANYEQGWSKFYLEPLQAWLRKPRRATAAAATKRRAGRRSEHG